MRRVFADTYYWIALLNDQDQGHATAEAVSKTLQGVTISTTQEELTEVLNFFSERGRFLRTAAATFIDGISSNPAVSVRPQSDQTFLDRFIFYKARPDKGYSQTDCISMHAIKQDGITEVLSNDDHFMQEGFTKLV
jgi:predicted nucleic acid-binding protein